MINYGIHRGYPSRSIKLGYKGKFGRRFQRNHNYKYYENIHMFRSGTFINAKLSDEPRGVKRLIDNSIKMLKDMKEELNINLKENASVAATSIISLLLVLNLYTNEIKNNKTYNTNIINIEEKTNTLSLTKKF